MERLFKILIIGDGTVGKTSFVQRYVNDVFRQDYKSTIGVDFALKVVKWSDTETIKLQMWDIAGQERFTSMTRVYYKDANAAIVMFDLSAKNTFHSALKWKRDLDSKCTLPDGSPVPAILLANKCDLQRREVDQAEVEAFCREHEFIGWTETSAKEGVMVDEAMRFLIEAVLSRVSRLSESSEGIGGVGGDGAPGTIRLERLTDRTAMAAVNPDARARRDTIENKRVCCVTIWETL